MNVREAEGEKDEDEEKERKMKRGKEKLQKLFNAFCMHACVCILFGFILI